MASTSLIRGRLSPNCGAFRWGNPFNFYKSYKWPWMRLWISLQLYEPFLSSIPRKCSNYSLWHVYAEYTRIRKHAWAVAYRELEKGLILSTPSKNSQRRVVHYRLSIPQRIQYKLGVMVHRCLQGRASQYLIDCCTLTSDIASRQRLWSATTRISWKYTTTFCDRFGRRALSIAGPRAWNLLPDHLRDPSLSSDSFRSAPKTSSQRTGTRSAVEAFCVVRFTNRRSSSSSHHRCHHWTSLVNVNLLTFKLIFS